MGSEFGKIFRISTWGESHGKAVGVVVDGVPSNLELAASQIQKYLDRRKPGQSAYTTKRNEADQVEILSGVFEGKTTGTPISLIVYNKDQRSKDYENIKNAYRPGHADYGYDMKYGFRDYRGGGRSSARETIGRVCAGAIAAIALEKLGILIFSYVRAIGDVEIENFDYAQVSQNPLCMPDADAAKRAADLLDRCIEQKDSMGSLVECRIQGVFAGLGDPVFDKLDAKLAQAIFSIGAVKGFSVGDGFDVIHRRGSENNDSFILREGQVQKASNHAGGILGGISDGDEIVFQAAFKPTPSIAKAQMTVCDGKEASLEIQGRHDPVIGPRAAVVVECMAAIVLFDAVLSQQAVSFPEILSEVRRNDD